MKIEEKTILWKPVSEYTGGRVLATNGLDILVGELNPEGDCVSEDCSGIHLCGITHFAKIAGFFPELKESEDERIRNQIINFIEEYGNPIHCEWQKDWIAWLEKQGEQKPTDKVKPKFKVGDIITHNTANFIFKIINVGSNGYEVVNKENYKKTISFDNEDNYHLWTIADAKDGDILVTENKNIFIFKSISDCTIYDYFRLYFGKFSENFSAVNGKVAVQPPTDCVPATKEQRDTLMKAMADAGYTFDFEKKELKKL